ncbi:MAG: S41 family peptidase [Christensenella sp.]
MKQNGFWKGFLSGITALFCVWLVVAAVGSVRAKNDVLNFNAITDKMRTLQSTIDENFYFEEDPIYAEQYIYKGMLAGVQDDYSLYMTPAEHEAHMRMTSGEYTGIGASVGQNPKTFVTTFSDIKKDSPAERAGIQVGDIILKVDGVDVTKMPVDEIISEHVLGEVGTDVSITVERDGEQIDLYSTRALIVTETVKHKMLDDDIGYLQITTFEDVTTEQFKAAADALRKSGAKGIIYDLRGNLGGSLASVVDILDYILPNGLIVYTADKNGVTQKNYSGFDGHEIALPSVVLMDENSASASEVFASAMRDYDWAQLVGEQTFGKGIVQNIFSLGDGSAVKLTTSAYFTKSGYAIHGNGLVPDVTVKSDVPTDPAEMLRTEEDTQLGAAVRAVKEEMTVFDKNK